LDELPLSPRNSYSVRVSKSLINKYLAKKSKGEENEPSQICYLCCIRYHIPRIYLNPKDNLLVIFEEERANPEKIEIETVDRDTVCSFITENQPPNINSWACKAGKFLSVVDKLAPAATITCPTYKTIKAVEFASFGDPTGICGAFVMGKCDAPATKQIVEQANKPLISFSAK